MSAAASSSGPVPLLPVAPGPHLAGSRLSTRRMMFDVLIGLVPPVFAALWLFGGHAARQIGIAGVSAVLAESLFCAMRGRRPPLTDGSAAVTGVILGLSLPPAAPWYVPGIGGFAAIGLGKALFGGLGQNVFNPAMVGRAFVMMAFPAAMGAAAYLAPAGTPDGLTQATPLTGWKLQATAPGLGPLFLGVTPGSIGETSALACLAGGLYLCLRRAASWQIPAGALAAWLAVSAPGFLLRPDAEWTALHHLGSGAFLLGAFFILTDPVTSPLTSKGKFYFGAGYGLLVLMMRRLSAYPEGVMFSVLLMNAFVPLINRATAPLPIGGPVPGRQPS